MPPSYNGHFEVDVIERLTRIETQNAASLKQTEDIETRLRHLEKRSTGLTFAVLMALSPFLSKMGIHIPFLE